MLREDWIWLFKVWGKTFLLVLSLVMTFLFYSWNIYLFAVVWSFMAGTMLQVVRQEYLDMAKEMEDE